MAWVVFVGSPVFGMLDLFKECQEFYQHQGRLPSLDSKDSQERRLCRWLCLVTSSTPYWTNPWFREDVMDWEPIKMLDEATTLTKRRRRTNPIGDLQEFLKSEGRLPSGSPNAPEHERDLYNRMGYVCTHPGDFTEEVRIWRDEARDLIPKNPPKSRKSLVTVHSLKFKECKDFTDRHGRIPRPRGGNTLRNEGKLRKWLDWVVSPSNPNRDPEVVSWKEEFEKGSSHV